MSEYLVTISNCLGQTPQAVEELLTKVLSHSNDSPLVFDMQQVDFVTPYGALLLLATARHVTENTGYKIRLVRLRDKVHAYLERMNLFTEGVEWLYCEDPQSERLSRSLDSLNILEITRLTSVTAQTTFQGRARKVLSTWLVHDPSEINDIVTVLSEICGNAAEHSKDKGHVMIQSYRHKAYTEVDIVVIDLGIGITGSLSKHYWHEANSDVEYIQFALDGYSVRGKQEGGAGLKIVQKHVARRNGELAIRSGGGLVVIDSGGNPNAIPTNTFPGTQVSIKLKGYRSLTE